MGKGVLYVSPNRIHQVSHNVLPQKKSCRTAKGDSQKEGAARPFATAKACLAETLFDPYLQFLLSYHTRARLSTVFFPFSAKKIPHRENRDGVNG